MNRFGDDVYVRQPWVRWTGLRSLKNKSESCPGRDFILRLRVELESGVVNLYLLLEGFWILVIDNV